MSEVLVTATAPAVRPSARRARTRQRLMDAAVEVFAARGVLGASVEEICEAAGFTRGAFYSNFADKDALVLALIEQGITAQYAAAERAIDGLRSTSPDLTPAERVAYVLSEFLEAGRPDRTGALAQQEMRLHAARVPALGDPYQQFAQTCRAELRGLIEDALRYSGLEFTVPFDMALELLMAAHEHMQLGALFSGELDPAPMHSLVMTMTRPRI